MNHSRLTSRNASQISFRVDEKTKVEQVECPICLLDWPREKMVPLSQCDCQFCPDCLAQYLSLEILAGSSSISCPDPACPREEAELSLSEVEQLVPPQLAERLRTSRLEREVRLDSGLAWCPGPDCQTVCQLPPLSPGSSSPLPTTCPACGLTFCPRCLQSAQPAHTCPPRQEPLCSEKIKWCPMCRVPIERDAGCAQMMCRRCRHVFCWYCMASLDVSTSHLYTVFSSLEYRERKI